MKSGIQEKAKPEKRIEETVMEPRSPDPRDNCTNISCLVLGPCPTLERCLQVLNHDDPQRERVQDAVSETGRDETPRQTQDSEQATSNPEPE